MDELRQLARILARAQKRRLRSTYVSGKEVDETLRSVRAQFGGRNLPSGRSRVAIAPRNQRVAALFFDKVWSPFGVNAIDSVPEDLAVYGGTPTEVWLTVLGALASKAPLPELEAVMADVAKSRFGGLIRRIDHPERAIAEALTLETGIIAVPVFSEVRTRSELYQPGKSEILLTSLDQVQLVDNDKLSWEQVREIRNDAESGRAMRQLFHWLDSEMIDRTTEYISGALEVRLQKYDVALKKHGVVTAAGILESLIDPKFIGAAAAVAAGGGLVLGSLAGAAGAIALTVGRITCTVLRTYADLIDTRGANADIAFVYQLSQNL